MYSNAGRATTPAYDGAGVTLGERSIERLTQVAKILRRHRLCGPLRSPGRPADRAPLIDYQLAASGQFRLGSFLFISRSAFEDTGRSTAPCRNRSTGAPSTIFARDSIDHPVVRIPEPLDARRRRSRRAVNESSTMSIRAGAITKLRWRRSRRLTCAIDATLAAILAFAASSGSFR